MKHELYINEQYESYEFDYVARQAAGSVLARVKDTVVLATVSKDKDMIEEDFLPLTVQYLEKSYAVGKIPGGYIKRETKPADHEILTARLIDRSLRPLFKKGYSYNTQIVVMVLSAGNDCDLQCLALNAASLALHSSDIPLNTNSIVRGVRIAKIDDILVLNPSYEELKRSTLDMFVSGLLRDFTKSEILMIEMRTLPSKGLIKQNLNELDENEVLDCIDMANKAIAKANFELTSLLFPKKIDPFMALKNELEDENLEKKIEEKYQEEIKAAIAYMAKSERSNSLDRIAKSLEADFSDKDPILIMKSLERVKKKLVRKDIIELSLRADGRALDEVRPINIETNLLPKAHGSCLFTRGATQALAVLTLGGDNDAQIVESLEEKSSDRFMFNYNFPGFCVGEASPLRAPSRRELGHANLAKRALYPSLDIDYPHSIRLVSEILESNGSSSMASVCAGSLALRAAGINSSKLIAGVAMGLVFEGDKHAVLTDIMGLEDHDGDMDFKVAGSIDGITALQMDIKLGGLDQNILKEALLKAKKAREHILALMEEANENIMVNEANLPKLECFLIEPSRMVEIIGQGGKTIKEIIEKFDVNIDLQREKGEVKISANTGEKAKKARLFIEDLLAAKNTDKKRKDTKLFKVGNSFEGRVKSVLDFGVFVELKDGVDGLLHAKHLRGKQLRTGEIVRVVIKDIKNNKIALSLI